MQYSTSIFEVRLFSPTPPAIALAVILFATGSARAGGTLARRAEILISADETGSTAIEYRVTLDSELSFERKAALDAETGLSFIRIAGPVTPASPGAPRPAEVIYRAYQPMQLSREGLAFSGDLPIARLAGPLAQLGISAIDVSIAVPEDVEGSVVYMYWGWRGHPALEKRSFSIPIAGAQDQLAPIHVAYGDRGPSGRGRFVVLALCSLVPLVFLIYALGDPPGRPGYKLPYYTKRLRRSRYEVLASLGLPVYWYVVISLLDIQRAIFYLHAFAPRSTRLAASLLWQIGPPLLLLVLCELIWLGKRRDARDITPPEMYGPGDRFLGCLIVLFVCGFLGMFFGTRPRLPEFHLACFLGVMLSAVFRAVGVDRAKVRDGRRRSRYNLDQWPLRSRIEQLVAIFDLATTVDGKTARKTTSIEGILAAPESAMMFDPCPTDWSEEKFIVLPTDIIERAPDSIAKAIASHQLTHLKGQPSKRLGAILGIGVLITVALGGAAGYRISIPLAAVAGWSAFFYYRRKLEFQADLDAVRVTRNPEAVIASIMMLSQEGFIPSDSASWRERKLWVPTPSERVRRIARETGIPLERVDDLVRVLPANINRDW
jgi:Zn-dependent protease with chaperone function